MTLTLVFLFAVGIIVGLILALNALREVVGKSRPPAYWGAGE